MCYIQITYGQKMVCNIVVANVTYGLSVYNLHTYNLHSDICVCNVHTNISVCNPSTRIKVYDCLFHFHFHRPGHSLHIIFKHTYLKI